MNAIFQLAQNNDFSKIWEIISQAILRRKADGSQQWQDGYPNEGIIKDDIENKRGYVLTNDGVIVGYCALVINDEPDYQNIQGKWLTDGDFVAFHRIAVSEAYLGKGYAQQILLHIEHFAKQHHIYSIKADTNFDNLGMLGVFEKLNYTYCGELFFRNTHWKAFEKILI